MTRRQTFKRLAPEERARLCKSVPVLTKLVISGVDESDRDSAAETLKERDLKIDAVVKWLLSQMSVKSQMSMMIIDEVRRTPVTSLLASDPFEQIESARRLKEEN